MKTLINAAFLFFSFHVSLLNAQVTNEPIITNTVQTSLYGPETVSTIELAPGLGFKTLHTSVPVNMPVKNIPPGTYFIQVKDVKEQMWGKILIKR